MPLALSTGLALPVVIGDSPTDSDSPTDNDPFDSPTDNDSSLNDGLLFFANLNETSGQRNDSGPNGLHLSDNGSVGSAAGVGVGQTAAAFVAASNQFLSRADHAAFRIGTNTRTFAVWLYLDASADQTFLGKGTSGVNGEYALRHTNTSVLVLNARNAANTSPLSSCGVTSFPAATWVFCVFGYDADAERAFFRANDGDADEITGWDHQSWSGGTNTSASNFVIGNSGLGASDISGRVMALGIWDRILTTDEQTFLYNGGTAARLYADLASFSPSAGLDASYIWWASPLAIRQGTNKYFGFINSLGMIGAARWPDGAANPDQIKYVHYGVGTDDHNAAALIHLNDGRLFISYQWHATETTLRHRVSTDGGLSFGSEVTITAPANVTYSQLHIRGNVLFRFHRSGGDWISHRCLDTTQASLTFESIVTLLEDSAFAEGPYINTQRLSNDVLRVFTYRHPTLNNETLKSFDINLSTGLVFSGSTEYGYLDGSAAAGGATLPVDFVELPTAYDGGSTNRIRLLNVSPDALDVAIAVWPESDNTAAVYKILRFTSGVPSSPTVIDVVAAGAPFYAPSTYLAGVEFATEAHSGLKLRVARKDGSNYKREIWESALGDGSDWVTTLLEQSASKILKWPLAVQNPHADDAAFWQQADTYTDFNEYTGNRVISE